MTIRQRSKPRGFTLIELLVVISIIGVLATLSVVALNSARAKARDAKRVAYMNDVSNAMQIYYDTASATFAGACRNGTGVILGAGGFAAPQVLKNCVGTGTGVTQGLAATLTNIANESDPSSNGSTTCAVTGGAAQTTACNYTFTADGTASAYLITFWQESKGTTGYVDQNGVHTP